MSDIKDDFWDIEKLLPKKKSTLSTFATKTKTVEYTVSGEEGGESSQNKLTLTSAKGEAESETYKIENGFIKAITITRFPKSKLR